MRAIPCPKCNEFFLPDRKLFIRLLAICAQVFFMSSERTINVDSVNRDICDLPERNNAQNDKIYVEWYY